MQVEGRIIICDAIDEIGITILKKAGLIVDYKPDIQYDELITSVKDCDVIIVRSRTKITKDIIDAAPNVNNVLCYLGSASNNYYIAVFHRSY